MSTIIDIPNDIKEEDIADYISDEIGCALKVGFKYNRIEIICQDYKFNKIKERLDDYEQKRQD